MLDSFLTESVEPSNRGVIARVGVFAFDVECSERDAARLTDGSPIYCQMEADDGDFHLVGFASDSRRELYRALRRVSGIGRRSALIVLDCGEAPDVLRAVSGKDTAFFRSVPGVGEKRIGAIIKELEKRFGTALPKPLPVPVNDWIVAREAILDRYQDPRDADIALSKVAVAGMDAEQLLEAALAGAEVR